MKNLSLIFIILLLIRCGEVSGEVPDGGSDTVITDDFRDQQWHLNNTGQKAFAETGGVPGEDINVFSVHAQGIKGKGIVINIIDSGLDLTHPDLLTDGSNSYDYLAKDKNPEPKELYGDHGTSVGGLIGMLDNNIGGLGVAPEATLIGHNLIEKIKVARFATSSEISEAFGVAKFLSGDDIQENGAETAHIINQSFVGNYSSFIQRSIISFEKQYKIGVKKGRAGKGYIFIKAAGNGFSALNGAFCNNAKQKKISCQNSNADPDNTVPENIVVSALNAEGVLTSYSTTGSSIWISAPGGEYGENKIKAYNVYGDNSIQYYGDNILVSRKAAMLTTDVVGCSSGYSRSENRPSSLFNYRLKLYDGFMKTYFYSDGRQESDPNDSLGPHPKNLNCDYINTFNGTSSAAPVVSGVAALILSANPDLTWRDVKHIFAKTSKKVDPMHTDIIINVNGSPLVIERGWIKNNANYDFSNKYGFGGVDAAAAVAEAQAMTANNLGDYFSTSNHISPNTKIKNNTATATSQVLTFNTEAPDFIESVELNVALTHPQIGEIMIELESPHGTKSILLPPFSSFTNSADIFKGSYVTSNAFYGEKASGNWTVRIFDVSNHNVSDGTVDYLQLYINGHN